jgi:hypothetical protein
MELVPYSGFLSCALFHSIVLFSQILCKSWQEINIEIEGRTGIAKLGKTPNPNTIQKRGVA